MTKDGHKLTFELCFELNWKPVNWPSFWGGSWARHAGAQNSFKAMWLATWELCHFLNSFVRATAASTGGESKALLLLRSVINPTNRTFSSVNWEVHSGLWFVESYEPPFSWFIPFLSNDFHAFASYRKLPVGMNENSTGFDLGSGGAFL